LTYVEVTYVKNFNIEEAVVEDPTYNKEKIDQDPVWKLAFWMSEIDNDNAPIGWSRYTILSRAILNKFNLEEK
jgi:hypothetical protein